MLAPTCSEIANALPAPYTGARLATGPLPPDAHMFASKLRRQGDTQWTLCGCPTDPGAVHESHVSIVMVKLDATDFWRDP